MIIQREQFMAMFGDPGPQAGGCYLTDVERRVLVALTRHVAPKTVIEFGVQDGKTAACIWAAAPTIKSYVGIDLPQGAAPALASQGTEVPAVPGEAVAGRKGFKLLLQESGTLVPADLPLADLIFIDGGHDYATVKHDTALAFARIRPGGVIVWHDYNAIPEIGVRQCIDELNQTQGDRCTLVQGTWLVFRFP
jgi:predicted O-methyltransferase YrrM